LSRSKENRGGRDEREKKRKNATHFFGSNKLVELGELSKDMIYASYPTAMGGEEEVKQAASIQETEDTENEKGMEHHTNTLRKVSKIRKKLKKKGGI